MIVHPEWKKSVRIHERECNSNSGFEVVGDYGPLSYSWVDGFRSRMKEKYDIDYFMKHPEYIDSERAEVTLKQIETYFAAFQNMLKTFYIDILDFCLLMWMVLRIAVNYPPCWE
jgi:hypothetical protein